MRRKLIGMIVVGLVCASFAFGATVTNTVKPLVPWGDIWRNKAIETLDAYETAVNINTLGTAIPLASNKVFIGTESGVGAGVTMSGGATLTVAGALTLTADSVTNSMLVKGIAANKIQGTALVVGDVWGSPGLSIVTNSVTEISVYAQTKTVADANLSERRLIRAYIAETSGGVASTNNIEGFALTGGTAVDTVTANADYRYVTSATGTNAITITGTAADQHFITVVDGSSTSEIQIDFVGP